MEQQTNQTHNKSGTYECTLCKAITIYDKDIKMYFCTKCVYCENNAKRLGL